MFKILLIDRCHFTRAGFEAWLNHSGLFPGHYVVTGLNNLFLAREHILQWKPSLVIADLHGFRQDTPHFQQFSSLLNASEKLPLYYVAIGRGQRHDGLAGELPGLVFTHEKCPS